MSPEHHKAQEMVEPFYFTRPTPTPDGAGGRTMTPVRNPSTGFHFAKVRVLRGQERLVGAGLAATHEALFVVDQALGILPTDTLVHNGVAYNIRRVSPVLQGTRFQEVEATSGEAL